MCRKILRLARPKRNSSSSTALAKMRRIYDQFIWAPAIPSPTTSTIAPVNRDSSLRLDGEGRRQIDDSAERPDEHALLDEPRAQRLNVGDPLQLDHADRALDPHVLHARQAAARRQARASSARRWPPPAPAAARARTDRARRWRRRRPAHCPCRSGHASAPCADRPTRTPRTRSCAPPSRRAAGCRRSAPSTA